MTGNIATDGSILYSMSNKQLLSEELTDENNAHETPEESVSLRIQRSTMSGNWAE